jgi:putative phosphoesterase
MAIAARHHVGVISDTHGLIRPEALKALRNSELIVHCGDIGNAQVLDALQALAPVRAIRGNNDKGRWSRSLPASDVVVIGGKTIYLLHNLSELDFDPEAAGFSAVICGHSHRPRIEKRGKVLFLNPGSAGPRRFRLPITVARLALGRDRCAATIVELEPGPSIH